MSSDTHNHDHDHENRQGHNACGSSGCGDIAPVGPIPEGGRSFQVSGLDCAEEVAILNRVIGPKVGGEEHLAFDVINGRMTLLESAAKMSDEDVMLLVASTGMTAKPWDDGNAAQDQAAHIARQRRFTILSGGFWAAGFGWHIFETGMGGALGLFSGHGEVPMPLPEAALFAVAILFGVWLVAPKAWSSARRLSPDMNLLMVVAVCGAIALGEFFEAATVAFFFSLSLYLESWSVGRARNAVSALLDLAPPTVRLVRADGSEATVPAADVFVGDSFIVRGGDRIPLDGEVIEGAGAVDQAPITGESALIPKELDDEVYAGTINGEGTLKIRATKTASDTVLAKIIRMVGDAHARRAPVEQWVTKFARIFTPIVMVVAVAIALIPPLAFGASSGFWFYNALVLLVIACPCALVISTPVSIVAALTASARAGVLIKGGAYIEAPGRTTALAMDKTGTITMGEPEVANVYPLGDPSEQELLASAASLEVRSSHPLARAILTRAEQTDISISAAEDIRTVPGRGLEGRIERGDIWLGSDRFAEEKGFGASIPAELRNQIESAGSTLVVVGDENGVAGLLELRDRIRPEARSIVARLHAQGVKSIIMLTGDNEQTARAVAAEVGIDEVRAQLLPEDKVAAIEELAEQHEMVAMIGDGVNDAPAMARAHYAVAMGAVGSDAAIETADIALMTDDIGKVPWLIDHSRRTMSIIRQNIGFSLATKALFVTLTGFGLASMWGAIAADVGVSLLVVANALRLLKAPEDHSAQTKANTLGSQGIGAATT
ncbi:MULTISPECIES: cation-translocating P-type ATPase [unclassified Ruegeria]|jgi:Cd2+/Zn2+-exporting ATPase|uniref:heavy metal translocating P-type ATPase n=1 Tax=unclassified Ruegeria TaxID=2625375 RepID=UPI00149116A0|nr:MULTISPECIES: cation-translocating P-type ATPase [unclassified Ruegeria]NOD90791.1 heavy metal translocating P-type ATPase [Ruegeria sp. HKCCD4318]NOE16093.1 heavy metal translocating P-type ATPase [Ruegeria sp. HKCCD4318-2]NOG11653.1 cation-translocating P-type ATPase [Ruegeria sp. HKCCD4315]UUV08511.1 cation-translocating P-type ATPase [Ruegeria sp. YS9]